MAAKVHMLSEVDMIGDTRRKFYAIEWIDVMCGTEVEQWEVFTEKEQRDKEALELALLGGVTKVITYQVIGDGMATQGEVSRYIEDNQRIREV